MDSDTTYLIVPKARSRVAGYYHLLDHPSASQHPRLDGVILVECKTLRHLVSSAAEAEVAGIFHNAQVTIPMKTDNSTAKDFI